MPSKEKAVRKVFVNDYKKPNNVYIDVRGAEYIKLKGDIIYLKALPSWITSVREESGVSAKKLSPKRSPIKTPVKTPSPRRRDFATDQVRYLAELLKFHDENPNGHWFHSTSGLRSSIKILLINPIKGFITGLNYYRPDVIATLEIRRTRKWNKKGVEVYDVVLSWENSPFHKADGVRELLDPKDFVATMVTRMITPPTIRKQINLRPFIELADSGNVGVEIVLHGVPDNILENFSIIQFPRLRMLNMTSEIVDQPTFNIRGVDSRRLNPRPLRKIYSIKGITQLRAALNQYPQLQFPYAIAIQTHYTGYLIEDGMKRNKIEPVAAIYPDFPRNMYVMDLEFEDLFYRLPEDIRNGVAIFNNIPALYIPYLVTKLCSAKYCSFCDTDHVEGVTWYELEQGTDKMLVVVEINTEHG